MIRSFAGQAALVTGATSGIGRALSVALATQGARVLLVGRDAPRAQALLAELPPAARPHAAVTGDLIRDEFLTSLVEQATTWCEGELSLLVHCAGHHEPATVDQTPAASFDAAIATNLRAPFLLTAGLLPALRVARGQVVLVNSSVAIHPRAGTAAYAASKAGLRTFADCLRAEVSADGLRVLSVFPGRTATPMQQDRYQREGLAYHPELLMQPEQLADVVLDALGSSPACEVTELHVRPLSKQ